MGPLSFLNGAFLFALAAAALPVLIHLFSRRRLREVPFSQLAFLDEITRRKVRRMRLRQWLLLALRTLAVVFLALALSRPVWQGAGAGLRRGSSTVAILIDDSFSMEARTDPNALLPVDASGAGLQVPTRFTEARQRAREALDLLEEGDRAVLVFTAAPVQIPYESTVRDPALLIEELERARPRPTRADLAGALERVYPLLASARTLNREILVISDFQRNQAEEMLRGMGARAQSAAAESAGTGVDRGAAAQGGPATEPSGEPSARPGEGGPAAAPSVQAPAPGRPFLALPEETRLYLLPVSTDATENAAVVGALYEKDPAGRGGRLTAQLRNLGEHEATDLTVQALAGSEVGALLGEGLVDLEPGAMASAVITLGTEPEGGMLAVRSAADLLERDNLRFLVTSATSRFKVLVVTGGSLEQEEIRDEARFALLALDPWSSGPLVGGGAAGAPASPDAGPASRLFEVRTIAETDLGLHDDLDVDAVVLLNVGRLSATAVERLERFQRTGGGILIALGNRVDPRMYNSQILPRLAGLRIENVQEQTDPSEHFTLRPATVGHDLFAGFPIAPGGALTGAQFQRIVQVRPGPQSRVLAEFSGALPALIEEPGMLLFASSLDLNWSDFPTSASFLPFLHRALLHLILGGRAGSGEPLVGNPLSWPLPPENPEGPYRCAGPGGLEIPVRVTQTDRGPVLLSDPAPEPGFYQVSSQGPGGRGLSDAVVAVNTDTNESDLRPMTAEQITLLFGTDAIQLERDEEISRQILETRHGRELWRLCLALAFAALLAESLIGRGRGLS